MSHLHDKVSGLVDGELAGATRTRALHHLRRCEACRDEVHATLKLKRRLGGLAAAEPPADLLSALGTLPSPSLVAVPLFGRTHTGRRAAVGAASMSAALLGVAYAVGAPEEPRVATVTPPVEQFAADFAGASGGTPLADPAVGALDAGGSSLTLLAVGQVSAPLAVAVASARSRGDESRAVGLLERATLAGQELAYSGDRRVTVLEGIGPSVVTVTIEHVPGQGTSVDVADGGNGAATFLATRDAAHAEGVAGGAIDLLVGSFDLAVAGAGRVADRQATIVSASRDDRLAARFWLDDESGLLLRRDLYDAGRLVRSSQFTAVTLSGRSFLAHLPPELGTPETTALSMTFAPSLNDQGWACPDQLPDDYGLVGLRRLQDDTVHATYTDGLSTMSVFQQRGNLDPAGLHGFDETDVAGQPVYVLDGLPTIVVWESDGTVYSLVSDAPDASTTRVVAALPHASTESPGTTDRVATGLQRLASFANPVD